MLKKMIVQRLEINSKEMGELHPCQLAFLVDLKFFVYKDGDGKCWFFPNSPKLAEALETIWIEDDDAIGRIIDLMGLKESNN